MSEEIFDEFSPESHEANYFEQMESGKILVFTGCADQYDNAVEWLNTTKFAKSYAAFTGKQTKAGQLLLAPQSPLPENKYSPDNPYHPK